MHRCVSSSCSVILAHPHILLASFHSHPLKEYIVRFMSGIASFPRLASMRTRSEHVRKSQLQCDKLIADSSLQKGHKHSAHKRGKETLSKQMAQCSHDDPKASRITSLRVMHWTDTRCAQRISERGGPPKDFQEHAKRSGRWEDKPDWKIAELRYVVPQAMRNFLFFCIRAVSIELLSHKSRALVTLHLLYSIESQIN